MKKTLGFGVWAFLTLLASIEVGAAQQSRIPQNIWQKAHEKGVVRVIVDLDVSVLPEIGLSKGAAIAQRQTIAGAQNDLLTELKGTTYKVTGRLKAGPAIGLEVGNDALQVLERSTLVKKVTEDLLMYPN
jgi:hypothetical protein